MRSLSKLVIALGALAAACGGGDAPGTVDADPTQPDSDPSNPDAPTTCTRTPAAADRVRALVVSKPYTAAGGQANAWEVYQVGTDGVVTTTGTQFEMGRAIEGEVKFTPDGEVGIVAQNDGTLGVFRLDGLVPTVVHTNLGGEFYAKSVTIDAAGEYVYIVDQNFRNNGGGLFRARINCDGSLATAERLTDSKYAHSMYLVEPGLAYVVARDVAEQIDESTPNDVFAVNLTATPPVVDHALDAFDYDDVIPGGVTFSATRELLLVGDINGFSAIPNRVAIASTGDGLQNIGLVDVEDPAGIRVSPFADIALVSSGFGDAIFLLARASGGGAFAATELDYVAANPQIPVSMAMIERGALNGHVYLIEVGGIRHLRFTAGGGAEDVALLNEGDGVELLAGAIGLQP